MEISGITPDDVQVFLNERKHLARKTLKEILTFMSEIFEAAIDDGFIDRTKNNANPTVSKKLINPSKKKTSREALSKEQILRILDQLRNLDGNEKRTLALMLLTGMRRGEVLGLRWEDLEILPELMANDEECQAGWIHVKRNVTYPTNQPNIDTIAEQLNKFQGKMYNRDMAYSEDNRRRAVGYYHEGHTQVEVEGVFKIGRKTLRDWEAREKGGSLKPRYPKNRKPRKLPPEELTRYAEEHPDAFLREIGDHFECSGEAVRKALKKLGYTRKKGP